MMKKTHLFALVTALCLVGASASASDFVPALDLSGELTYPSVVSNQTLPDMMLSGSGNFAGSFMANTDLLPQLWFVPTLTVDYSNTAQPLSVEDSRFLFAQWLDIYFSYGLNYDLSDSWLLRARGTVRSDFSKQTADELMGDGLYDFIDSGLYLENENKFDAFGGGLKTVEGVKYIDRRFRNYSTLISQYYALLPSTPDVFTKEKDNDITSAYIKTEASLGNSGWHLDLDFNYDYMQYTQQRVIASDGTLEDGKRQDKTGTFTAALPYIDNTKSGFVFEYDLIRNISSQNFYDDLGTIDVTDDVYTPGFYDYLQNTFKFRINYEIDWNLIATYKPMLAIGFSTDFVGYDKRMARDADGAYTGTKQADNNYSLSLNVKQGITDFWDCYLDITYSRYNSNTQWQALGLYNYAYFTASIGTGLKF
jgi:hypothetical protein